MFIFCLFIFLIFIKVYLKKYITIDLPKPSTPVGDCVMASDP